MSTRIYAATALLVLGVQTADDPSALSRLLGGLSLLLVPALIAGRSRAPAHRGGLNLDQLLDLDTPLAGEPDPEPSRLATEAERSYLLHPDVGCHGPGLRLLEAEAEEGR